MYKLIDKNRINDTIYFQIECKTPMATEEYSVCYDVATRKFSGDVLCYGEIMDIPQSECIELLEIVLTPEQLNDIKRSV